MNREIRELVRETIESNVEIMKKMTEEESWTGPDISNDFRLDVARFLMYLSASDNKIAIQEAEVIAEMCGIDLPPEELGKIIKESYIYSEAFEKHVPRSLEMAVILDNAFNGDVEGLLSDIIINTFQLAGKELIEADGKAEDVEIRDYNIYINMLEDYKVKELKSNLNNATGFTKEKGPVLNDGVPAPKKG